MNRASMGKLTHITRNSHIADAVVIAIANPIATPGIVDHLSKFVFGRGVLGYEIKEGIAAGSWMRHWESPLEIAEING
jgi:hypothetical protein